HYRNPERGQLLMLALHGQMERLSRLELKRLKVHAIWALRRRKMKHGNSSKYLHGPSPRDVRLTADEKELFEQLNHKDTGGDPRLFVDNLSTNSSRLHSYMSMRRTKEFQA